MQRRNATGNVTPTSRDIVGLSQAVLTRIAVLYVADSFPCSQMYMVMGPATFFFVFVYHLVYVYHIEALATHPTRATTESLWEEWMREADEQEELHPDDAVLLQGVQNALGNIPNTSTQGFLLEEQLLNVPGRIEDIEDTSEDTQRDRPVWDGHYADWQRKPTTSKPKFFSGLSQTKDNAQCKLEVLNFRQTINDLECILSESNMIPDNRSFDHLIYLRKFPVTYFQSQDIYWNEGKHNVMIGFERLRAFSLHNFMKWLQVQDRIVKILLPLQRALRKFYKSSYPKMDTTPEKTPFDINGNRRASPDLNRQG